MSMLTDREAAALESVGKLGRFIRTQRCARCDGKGLEVFEMTVDLCPRCGGSGRLAVYTDKPAPSAGPAPTEEHGR